ncbi:WD40 repeat domain-containing serine/threonine protein kinase [Streptosporangium sp. NBC_01756]|uniref:WD40 repeat domain-containing serine/threonine protein kinase n=1 Tax=Streptosporangium sp. NBC_01756 TaxID=2975950 RepID=UPI002DDA8980|nr:protein kinase [Streptosporangium sp. NBC_01756]WSC90708.1 serine/threonine-protein kinase [Streptosporangium sp. NBC_01756]
MSQRLGAGDPQRIGDHLLAGRLGEGGQGVVYDAYDPDGHRVAIKLLHADADRARIAREIAAATRVSSFCTARVLHADLDVPRPYIVSEFIDGPSLRQAVQDTGPLAGDRLRRLAIAVATAMTAIHGAGVVHRDLKPDNVLLGPDGPRVIDFGIARTAEMSLTSTGLVVGTPTYMAPEVLAGARAGAPADVFAFGAIVLYAATGHDPFRAETLGAVMHRVLSVQPDVSPLPPDVRPLVSAALAKDPADRPAARELLLALLGQDSPEAGSRAAAVLRAEAAPSLGQVAEEVFARLGPGEQEVVPQILLRLVSADGREARGAGRAEIDASPEAERVLAAFAAAGLVRVTAEVVTLERPGLLRAWPRLREWSATELPGLPVRQRVSDAARLWEAGGRKDGDLLQGTPLDEAMEWAATGRGHIRLNHLETAFLRAAASLSRHRVRRRRLFTAALAVLLAVALAATVIAEQRRITVAAQGERIAAQLDEAVARRLAGQADALRRADPLTAMRLSAAAYAIAPVAESRAALQSSLTQRETSVVPAPRSGTHYTLSVDGTTMVGAGTGVITLWDAASGRELRSIRAPGLVPTGIAQGATREYAAIDTAGGLRLWDLRTGRRLPGAYGEAGSWAAISPAGTDLLSFDGPTLVVRDLEHRKERLRVPGDQVWGRAAGGGRAVTTSGTGAVRLWDLRTGRALRAPALPEGTGTVDAALSADGRTLVLEREGALTFRDVDSGRRLGEIDVPRGGHLLFAPDGRTLAVLHQGGVTLVGVPGVVTLLDYSTDEQPTVESVRFSEDGRALRFVDGAGSVVTLGVPGRSGAGIVQGGTLSPDGARTAAQTAFGTHRKVEVRDARTGRAAVTMTVPPTPPAPESGAGSLGLVFSPDGATLAVTPDSEPVVHLFDTTSGARLGELRWDGKSASRVAFDAAGKGLAVAASSRSDRPFVQLWDVASRRQVGRLPGGDTTALALAFHPDGARLAQGSPGGVALTPLRDGAAAALDGVGDARAVSFDPGGGLLAVGDAAGRVQLWETATRRPRGPAIAAHPGGVDLAVFSPDGRLLVTSGGGRVALWDAASGGQIGQPAAGVERAVTGVAFPDGGRTLRTVSADGTVVDRPLDPGRAAGAVCSRAGGGLSPQAWARHIPELAYRPTCR